MKIEEILRLVEVLKSIENLNKEHNKPAIVSMQASENASAFIINFKALDVILAEINDLLTKKIEIGNADALRELTYVFYDALKAPEKEKRTKAVMDAILDSAEEVLDAVTEGQIDTPEKLKAKTKEDMEKIKAVAKKAIEDSEHSNVDELSGLIKSLRDSAKKQREEEAKGMMGDAKKAEDKNFVPGNDTEH